MLHKQIKNILITKSGIISTLGKFRKKNCQKFRLLARILAVFEILMPTLGINPTIIIGLIPTD